MAVAADDTQALERPRAGPPLDVDVAVVGAGPTGMIAALCAAEAGYAVAMIAPPAGEDPRTTALLMPSVKLLTTLGVWDRLSEETAPLVTMRIVDATDRLPRAPEIAFDAHEVGLDQFGFNCPNEALNRALAERLDEGGVTRVEAVATGFLEGNPAVVTLADRDVCARLVVAADGSQSTIRQAAGIAVREWSYDQSAFVTMLSHERPHDNVSTEFHTAGGAFTLVPLPGRRSSLVWMGRPDEAERWSRLDPGPLAREIETRAHHILGRMTVDGPRGVIPMKGMIAHRFGEGRVVLVGEAAHRFPPIGAQGLNLGIRDVAVLFDLLRGSRQQSFATIADRYDRRRRVDVGARTLGVDLLNRSLLTGALPITAGRTLAHAATRGIGPLRRVLMRAGLGGG